MMAGTCLWSTAICKRITQESKPQIGLLQFSLKAMGFSSPLHLIMSHKPGNGPQVADAWMALLNLSWSIYFLREKMITDAAPSPSLSHCSCPSSDHCKHQSNSISCVQSDLGGLCALQQAVLSIKGNSQMGYYCSNSKSWPLSHLGGEQLPSLASVPGPS